MRSTRPLDRFSLINTSSLDETRAALAHAYAKPELELVGRNRALHAVVNGCRLQHIGLNYGSYDAMLRMQFPETDFASQIFTIKGRNEALINGTSVIISSDCGVVISSGEALRMTNCEECERLVLRVDLTALMSNLAAITGDLHGGPVKFDPIQNYKLPAAKALRSHYLFLVSKLSECAAPLPKLVLTEFEQMLIVMFLQANRHNYSHRLEQAPQDTAPCQVRRVEDYIEANWRQAITLENLAAVSGVSALALFRAFRKSRGHSPMEFANRVRLCRAREMLQRPDAATAVAEVASACGFIDLAYFVRDYFRAFGEQPSQTLGRG